MFFVYKIKGVTPKGMNYYMNPISRETFFEHTHIFPYIRYCAEDRHDGGWILNSREINDYEFIYITAGIGEFVIENRKHTVREDDLIFLSPDTAHSARAVTAQFCFYCVHFDIYIARNGDTRPFQGVPSCPVQFEKAVIIFDEHTSVSDSISPRRLLGRVVSESYFMSPASGLLGKALFTEFLAGIFQSSDHPSGKMSPEIAEAVRYIRQNCSKRPHLDEIAVHVHLQPNYLSGLFKKQTGRSTTGFINACRIFEAKGKLLNTAMSLEEIAEELGFYDTRHFSRVFRKEEGLTPAQFRKMPY